MRISKEKSQFILPSSFAVGHDGVVPIVAPEEIEKHAAWGNLTEDTFVETGTFWFHGVINAMLRGAKYIHSVEINEQCFLSACFKCMCLAQANPDLESKIYRRHNFFSVSFANGPRISLYYGDSRDYLPHILNRLEKKSTVWLDAHHGGDTCENVEDLDVNDRIPIFEELDIISKHHIKDHTIMIDDIDCVGDLFNGGKNMLEEKIKSINPNYKIEFRPKVDTAGEFLIARVPTLS